MSFTNEQEISEFRPGSTAEAREELLKQLWKNGRYTFDPQTKTTLSLRSFNHGPSSRRPDLDTFFEDNETQLKYLLDWLQQFSGKIPLDWAHPTNTATSLLINNFMYACRQNSLQLPKELIWAAISYPDAGSMMQTSLCQGLDGNQLLFILLNRKISPGDIERIIRQQKEFAIMNAAEIDETIKNANQLELQYTLDLLNRQYSSD